MDLKTLHNSSLNADKTKYTLIGVVTLLLWASNLPFMKRCSEDLGPFTTGFIQFFPGGLLGLVVNKFIFKQSIKNNSFFKNKRFYFRILLLLGNIVFLFSALHIVERKNLPLITLINYLWPTSTMLLSVIILKQKCNKALLIFGSILVVIGLGIDILGTHIFEIINSSQSMNTILGSIFALIGGSFWALYAVMNRKWGALAGESAAIPFIMLASSISLIPLIFIFEKSPVISNEIIFPSLYLMISPYIANLCWDLGTRRGNIVILSLLADALPWASLTVASLYLGITIGKETWISAVVIVAGALISRYSLRVGQK
jgi:drug/metabolite transporter (DMT)-like permease